MPRTLKSLIASLSLSVSGVGPLAEAALALALADRPGAKAAPYDAKLAAMMRDAQHALGSGPEAFARPPEAVAMALMAAIHGKAGLSGDTETYDDPRNADLIHVLERKKGLPVTLGIIYIHVARALGIEASGLNMPSHFLVRLETSMGKVVIDPFAGGALFTPEAMAELVTRLRLPPVEVQNGLARVMTDADVLMRLLNNIRNRAKDAEDFPLLEKTCDHMLMFSPEAGILWFDLGAAQARNEKPGAAIKALAKAVERGAGEPYAQAAEALYKVLKARLN